MASVLHVSSRVGMMIDNKNVYIQGFSGLSPHGPCMYCLQPNLSSLNRYFRLGPLLTNPGFSEWFIDEKGEMMKSSKSLQLICDTKFDTHQKLKLFPLKTQLLIAAKAEALHGLWMRRRVHFKGLFVGRSQAVSGCVFRGRVLASCLGQPYYGPFKNRRFPFLALNTPHGAWKFQACANISYANFPLDTHVWHLEWDWNGLRRAVKLHADGCQDSMKENWCSCIKRKRWYMVLR